MNVDVTCPACGKSFTVRDEVLGKRTKCTACGQIFVLSLSADGFNSPLVPPPPPPIPAEPPFTPQTSAPFVASSPPPSNSTATAAREFFAFEQDSSVPRFPALRRMARIYETLAWVFCALAMVFIAIVLIATVLTQPSSIVTALIAAITLTMFVVLVTTTILFWAQMIRLMLQLEQNTRETRDACRAVANQSATNQKPI